MRRPVAFTRSLSLTLLFVLLASTVLGGCGAASSSTSASSTTAAGLSASPGSTAAGPETAARSVTAQRTTAVLRWTSWPGVTRSTASERAAGRSSAAKLRAEVVATLRANHELALRVLWTDRLPANARRSTAGPALAAMRASAAGREQARLRVRLLRDSYRIVSIRLGRPALSAVVQSNQELLPSSLEGRALGQPVELDERARIELRRIGRSKRLVVWRLSLQPTKGAK